MVDPVGFAEPWEARAFALVRSLRDDGVVSAQEWTDALRAQVGDEAVNDVGYRHWLAALESVLTTKGVVAGDALQRYRIAWAHAAGRTPHGEPIALMPTDFHD